MGNYYSRSKRLQQDVEFTIGEILKTFGALKMKFNVRKKRVNWKSDAYSGDVWSGDL